MLHHCVAVREEDDDRNGRLAFITGELLPVFVPYLIRASSEHDPVFAHQVPPHYIPVMQVRFGGHVTGTLDLVNSAHGVFKV